MKGPHTNFRKGQRVLVIFRDGSRIEDKYLERTGKFILLENHRLRSKCIRSMTIPR